MNHMKMLASNGRQNTDFQETYGTCYRVGSGLDVFIVCDTLFQTAFLNDGDSIFSVIVFNLAVITLMRLPDYKIYMGIKGAHMKNQALAAPKNDPKNQPMIEHDNIQVDM